MTKTHADSVGNLTEDAFHNLQVGEVALAQLQMMAAQASATLALAQEVRAVALILSSGAPVGPTVELAREAFTVAAIHLGLVDTDDPDDDGESPLYADGTDPADRDVEL